MIDWFVLLAPVVLLPLVLLFAFVGCTGTFQASSERLSLLLLSSVHLPMPAWVVFTWEGPGDESGAETVEEPRPEPVEVDGEQYWEFECVIQEPQEGQWTISCAVWTMDDGRETARGRSVCGPFYRPAHSWLIVKFELIPRDGADDQFEVVNRACPESV